MLAPLRKVAAAYRSVAIAEPNVSRARASRDLPMIPSSLRSLR
jgi:hypothetical protein